MNDRGQAFTFEAVAAALLLVGTVAFITQAPGITPLTTSTASEQAINQQRGVAAGVLDVAAQRGAIKSTILYWNKSTNRFHGTSEDDGYYIDGGPPTAFGELLDNTFSERDSAFNVDIVFLTDSNETRRLPIVKQGTPTSEASRVSRTLILFDDDVLRNPTGDKTDTAISNTSSFYAPDVAPGNRIYNVVRVEVVIWRV